MKDLRNRSQRVLELLKRQHDLGISMATWRRATMIADPAGKGVSYQTIRRVSEGVIPSHRTLDKLEAGIEREEQASVRSAA